MAAKDLNIRLGLIFDEKSLARVESRLRRSGEKLSRIGTDLSLSLSAPLAAFGAVSIKAAGDLESLTLALQSQLGSAEAAKKELAALTEVAKNPGLGLEQVVRASVSLQAVGQNADSARKIITEFGNALALAGKGRAEVDGVVLALTQISAKGKVSAEEINQIAERLPQIRTLMKNAFGTASTEDIQKLGITAEQFINVVVKQLEELPRAQGGIKNSLENTFDSLKQSLAKVGFAINNTFDIAGAAESFGNFVVGIAEGFANLNPVLQNVVLGMGALLISVGPLVKIFGTFKLLGSQLTTVWAGIGVAAKTVANSFNSVGLAANSIKWGPLITLVAGLGAAMYSLYSATRDADSVSKQFAESTAKINQESAKEIGLINQAFDSLKNESIGREEKKAIIDKLLAQYPDYLKGIDLESASISKLIEVQKSLNGEILRGVAERQKATAVNAIYEKQAAILLRIQQLKDGAKQTASEALLVDTGDVLKAGGVAAAVIEKLQAQSVSLGQDAVRLAGEFDRAFGTFNKTAGQAEAAEYRQRDAYYAAKEAQEERIKTLKAQADALKDQEAQERAIKLAKVYKEVISDINNEIARQGLLGAKDIIAEAEAIEGGIKKLLDAGFTPASKAVQDLKGQLKGLFGEKPANFDQISTKPTPGSVTSETATTPQPKTIDDNTNKVKSFAQALGEVNVAFQESAIGFNEAFSQVATLVQTQGSLMQQTFFGIATAMQEAASQGAGSLSELASAATAAAAKIVRAWIQQGVAAAVARALSSLPFPANLAAGAVAGSLAAALFTKGLNKIGLKGFARGTQFAPGGLALVGEQGPELMNIPRGAQISSNSRTNRLLDGAGGNMNVSGEFTVRGTDLVLVLDRVQSKNKRIR